MGSGVATVADKQEFCTYASVKVDAALLQRARWAAAKTGKTIQEWLSDAINLAAAEETEQKPLKRLPPPPRKKRESGD